MKTIYLGIDPGKSGGMAAIMPDGTAIAEKWTDETEIMDEIRVLQRHGSRIQAVIEHVQGGMFSGTKEGRMGAVSAFTFGENFGLWHGLMLGLGIPFRRVMPKQWQTGIQRPKKASREQLKRAWKAEAVRRFPEVKPTNATADALLIADWARREGL